MCLCPPLMKGLWLAPAGSFVLGEAINPLPKVFQEGDCSLPMHHRNVYTTLCTLGPAPHSVLQFHSRKSHVLPKPQFELQALFAKKNWDNQDLSFSSPWSREVLLLWQLDAALSQPLFLSLHFVSPWKGFPHLHSTTVFLSPNTLPHTLYLPCCLSPTMEILLPFCRSISRVFQVM